MLVLHIIGQSGVAYFFVKPNKTVGIALNPIISNQSLNDRLTVWKIGCKGGQYITTNNKSKDEITAKTR